MTEREAWRKIGKAFERYAVTGALGRGGCWCGCAGCDSRIASAGLCNAVSHVCGKDGDRLEGTMFLTLNRANPGGIGYWWHGIERTEAIERAMLAYFLAESCDA